MTSANSIRVSATIAVLAIAVTSAIVAYSVTQSSTAFVLFFYIVVLAYKTKSFVGAVRAIGISIIMVLMTAVYGAVGVQNPQVWSMFIIIAVVAYLPRV